MNKQQRQRKLNLAADAIFGGGVSDDEYERIKEAANYRPCPYCGDSFRWTLQSYTGPETKLGNLYCTERYVKASQVRLNKPGLPFECEKCHSLLSLKDVSNLFYWNARTGYESDSLYCDKCGERENAPLVKPQPKRIEGVNSVDGWDI